MDKVNNKKAGPWVRAIGSTVMELVFPKSLYCICCGNLIDSSRTYNLCDHCVRHIRWDRKPPEVRRLQRCDGQTEQQELRRFQEHAGRTELPVLRCTEYGIYERTLIFSLKYGGNKYISKDIARMMTDKLDLVGVFFDVCVPIPLSEKKKKSRGFNQAELIAKHIARRRGADIAPEALCRTRDTRPMRGLGPSERAANIRGSIDLGRRRDLEKVKGKRVLLVDDFFTTGSTAFECVRVLERAGPASVIFMAFAAR